MKCTNCGKEITDGQKFCKYCGAPVKIQATTDNPKVKICSKCGAPIKDGFAFCDQCGTPIDGPEKPRKKGIGIGKVLCILLFTAVLAGAGMLIFKRIGNSNQAGNTGDSTEIAIAESASGTAEEQPASESPTGMTEKQGEAETTSGTAEKQPAVESPTGTTEKQGEGEVTSGTAEEQPVSESPTGTTEKQGETEEPHILPSAVPDEYYEHNGHTYAFYDAHRYDFSSYQEIVDFCEDQGGHLAVINDRNENTYLFELLRNHYDKTAFFGYSDEDYEGSWEWADGSDREYENWTNYGTWDLPDNGKGYGGDEDYAEFNYARSKSSIPNDGTWNDAPFMANTTIFICEWEFDVVKELQE